MQSTSEISAFDRGIQAVMKIVLPENAEEIVAFRADPELQARIEALARKSTEDKLTDAERAEYTGYVRANKYVAILKRQAQATSVQRKQRPFQIRPRLEAVIESMLDGHIMLDEALQEFEKMYIEKAFTRNKKRIAQTAEALGIHRKKIAKRVNSNRTDVEQRSRGTSKTTRKPR